MFPNLTQFDPTFGSLILKTCYSLGVTLHMNIWKVYTMECMKDLHFTPPLLGCSFWNMLFLGGNLTHEHMKGIHHGMYGIFTFYTYSLQAGMDKKHIATWKQPCK
jgi:hypothetical protein